MKFGKRDGQAMLSGPEIKSSDKQPSYVNKV